VIPQNIVEKMDPKDREDLQQKTSEERASKVDLTLEREIHSLIQNELSRRQVFYIHSRTDRKTTQEPGVPDFILGLKFVGQPRPVGIEVKLPGKNLSEDQEIVKAEMIQCGWHYHLVHSFQEFKDVLEEYDV